MFSGLNSKLLCFIFLSFLGHFGSTYVYSFISSDSHGHFFLGAQGNYVGHGTQFVQYMTWIVRYFITGDSYLATLYFFSAFAFLGSVLWYCLYCQTCKWLDLQRGIKDAMPMFILLCWPSFIFFTTGIGKDSLSFFLIPIIFLMGGGLLTSKKNKEVKLVVGLVSLGWLTLIRPYLLIIFISSYYCSGVQTIKRLKASQFLILIIMIPVVFLVANKVVQEQARMEEVSFSSISERAVLQQSRQDKGTSFPILSKNPVINLLCLPYGFVMNLTMPLFVFARNVQGLLSSIENSFLVYLIYQLWKRKLLYKELSQKYKIIRFYFYFFMIGMSFMALINVNLGLSARQKSMYIPPLFIVMMVVIDARKNYRNAYENSRYCKLCTINP